MVTFTESLRAIKRARNLAIEFQVGGGSVDLYRLAAAFGVQSIEPAEMSADGYLGRKQDGALVIRYRSQNGTSRNRFTVAHEVAHLLLADVQGKQLVNRKGGYVRDGEEETVVNRIAAELLMPASTILNELRQRQLGREYPSWKLIADLSSTFKVSRSAMAFRILEVPHIWAISLRINIEGRGPLFPLDRSEGSRLRLVNGVEFEMERLWREAKKTSRHVVPVRLDNREANISCNGMVRSMTTRLGRGRHYWVVGWRVVAELDTNAGADIHAFE